MGTIRNYLALGVSLGLLGCGGELAKPVVEVKPLYSSAPVSAPVEVYKDQSVEVKKDPNAIVVDSENDENRTEQVGTWDFGDGASISCPEPAPRHVLRQNTQRATTRRGAGSAAWCEC